MTCPNCSKDTPRFWKGTCNRCYAKQHRIDNIDLFLQRERNYHTKNKEKRLAYTKNWNEANRESIEKRQWGKRILLDQIKEKDPCKDCRNRFPAVCMDFDHIDPTTKVNCVTKLLGGSWERTLKEIEKCELVCSNCHRLRTKARLNRGNQ